jgi:hypothetical protein
MRNLRLYGALAKNTIEIFAEESPKSDNIKIKLDNTPKKMTPQEKETAKTKNKGWNMFDKGEIMSQSS